MLIQKTRIRSLENCFAGVTPGSTIVVGVRLSAATRPQMLAIGFPEKPAIGDSILPAIIGPVTRRNAEGDLIIHRDQPKETATRLIEWHWEQFRGRYEKETVSDFRNRSYKRFPRTKIPPQSVELKITVTADGQRILVGPPMTYTGDDDPQILHVVNLFLEAFGFCETFSKNLEEIIKAPLRRLNWNLLPKGKRTWDDLKKDLNPIVARAAQGNQVLIRSRFQEINRFGPDFVAIGLAGFAGYVVFGFTDRNLFVLESIYTNNATYVFGTNWQTLSQLTKSEVIENDFALHRVVHLRSWYQRIRAILTVNKPK
jgi:hypothetical protein